MNLDWRRIEVVDNAMAEVLRQKTPAERIAIGFGLWRTARLMLQAQLAVRHPEWDAKQLDREVARRLSHGVEEMTRPSARSAKLSTMKSPSALSAWSPEQIALGKRWVQAWKEAGPELERVRRAEIRKLDAQHSIALLCGEMDYTLPPRAPKPTSGLVEQQRWFMKASRK